MTWFAWTFVAPVITMLMVALALKLADRSVSRKWPRMRVFGKHCYRFGLLALLSCAAIAHEPGPHVHGIASLQVAIDGTTLTVNLESPLDNLLGFEHAARTDQERKAVSALRARLQKPAGLFVPTPAASCTVTSVKLESPVFEERPVAEKGDAHADLDAEFAFTCLHPDRLRDLEVKLFESFPGTRQINAQVAGPKGQAAAKLTAAQRRIAW